MSDPQAGDPKEQEIERLRAELQAARSGLGDFAYAVSHDLRASLRHIMSYASLLREEIGPVLPGETANYLDTIQGASRTLGQQIDGLMAWSQLDRVELQILDVDSEALVSEARTSLAEACAGRQIEWELPQEWPVLRGDAALLRQLFQHLLSNAVKFTRPRDKAAITLVAESTQDGVASFYVQDNGVGFDPVRQFKLFHVFQRLHSAGQFEGLGLGLALAQKIAHRHGGHVYIEATLDAGCRVAVTLPAAS